MLCDCMHYIIIFQRTPHEKAHDTQRQYDRRFPRSVGGARRVRYCFNQSALCSFRRRRVCVQRAIFFCRLKIFAVRGYKMLYHTRAHARKNDIPSTWYPPCLSLPPLLLLFTKIYQPYSLPLCVVFVCCRRTAASLANIVCVCQVVEGAVYFWSIAAELPRARRFNCTTTLLLHFVGHLLQETPRETP